MTTHKEALKLTLEALQDYVDEYGPWSDDSGAQYVLRVGKEALAQPAVTESHKQEPKHVATVAEVHMSRYTIEWTSGPLPEGTKLYGDTYE